MKFMAQNWKQPVTSFVDWQCPECGDTLKEDRDNRQLLRSNKCKADQNHDAWEPEWIDGRFSTSLHCEKSCCGSMVCVGGRWRVQRYEDYDEHGLPFEDYSNWLTVDTVSPSVKLFETPIELPNEVERHLSRAFALYWNDKASCLNALRAALEASLSEQGVPKKFKTKKGKFQDAKLHQRIERFGKTNGTVAELLMAIKWLGNQGSHDFDAENTLADKVDSALTIMAVALFELYDPTKSEVQTLVKKINKSKG
ncbi:DUF4145 domain-containing protein [uncultured Tateyamaria sp.]|uniref:DUF4145 domain-containing protein n=1 Tax=uncultured Tateyamaria sp. TaxID=455651 RepID=UPI00263457D4|nr:DUF4145 domain-containing protein [uncultured Tateyamaria sp.]